MNLVGVLPELLRERGMTQKQLAAAAQISRTDVNAMANGKLEVGPARLKRLADALEVTTEDLGARAAKADVAALLLLDRLPAVEARLDELKDQLDEFSELVLARLAALEGGQVQPVQQSPRRRKAGDS